MKLSEFANIYKVSERHVRRLIKKYESDMVGHYEQRGNEGTFIDDVGAHILKSKLKEQFDMVVEQPSDRERQLEQTLTALSIRYADAMEQIANNASAVALLEVAKDNIEKLEARTSAAEERAARASERADQVEQQAKAAIQRKIEADLARKEAEADRKQAVETLEEIRREVQLKAEAVVEAEKRAREAEDVAESAKAEAEDLRALIEQLLSARGFKRRKLLKELKEIIYKLDGE